jgi:hypothetical protein
MGPDMRRFAAASRAILVVLGGLRASATASSEVCGRPNAPPCALQAWMRARMAQPYAARRFGKVAADAAALRRSIPTREGGATGTGSRRRPRGSGGRRSQDAARFYAWALNTRAAQLRSSTNQ